MSQDQRDKIRPSQENTAIADYYLADPKLAIAIQEGGLVLGPIASHIVVSYSLLKKKVEDSDFPAEPRKVLTAAELDRFRVFEFFVKERVPLLAAELGPNITDKLIDGAIQATKGQVIVASGLQRNLADLEIPGLDKTPLAPSGDGKATVKQK